MENVEGVLSSPKERTQLITQLRSSCEQLLIKYGKVEKVSKFTISFQKLGKALGLRQVPPESSFKKLEAELVTGGGKEKMTISSTSEDPATSEFIKIKGEKHMNELFLSKTDARILENWGMGESIHNEEQIVEAPSLEKSGVEMEYSNPRQATAEEIGPYKSIVDAILRNHPLA